MSELSERDKQLILGQTRVNDDRVEQIKQEVNSPAKKLASFESQKMTAVFLALTGCVLLIGGFVLNGTQVGYEKGMAVAFIAVGVLWYVYLNVATKRLLAAGPTAG
ncbi:MAG: hypothetical protein JWN07_1952 [Hyphomicrobiales bacterium]|nr:hypothetical protein [Hyphomicrobiales bacterium]